MPTSSKFPRKALAAPSERGAFSFSFSSFFRPPVVGCVWRNVVGGGEGESAQRGQGGGGLLRSRPQYICQDEEKSVSVYGQLLKRRMVYFGARLAFLGAESRKKNNNNKKQDVIVVLIEDPRSSVNLNCSIISASWAPCTLRAVIGNSRFFKSRSRTILRFSL